VTAEEDIRHLLLSLLQGFYWCDEGLQNYLRARGWPSVTRSQSMVMANVALGVRRPSEIARRLGVSRQAIHATIAQMTELGIVELVDDPTNGRVKIVATTAQGDAMRADAQNAMVLMGQALSERLGRTNVLKTAHLLHEDWGPPLTFDDAEPKAGS
jgi:DNA-binding MarR family transcriptional regulator